MDGVKAMGPESTGSRLAFPSLEFFVLKNMKRLEVWSTDIGVVSFPCLKKLVIRSCPNLVQVSVEVLPSLIDLHIFECDSGVLKRLVQAAPSVKKLKIESISGLNDVVWRGVIEYLGAVEYLSIIKCNELRYLWESTANVPFKSLRNLDVQECQNLVRLGTKEEEERNVDCWNSHITTLRELKIRKCESMEHCRCPNNIEDLQIADCKSITSYSFPTKGVQKLKCFRIIGCNNLLEKELVFKGDNSTRVLINNQSMPMLNAVLLAKWPTLTTINKLSHFIHLTFLAISDCPNLKSFPDHELPSLTSLASLYVVNCPSIDALFPRGLWPPKMHTLAIGALKKPILEWGAQNFPASLVKLALYSGESEDDVSRSSQLSHLLPSSLTTLSIRKFKKLKSLSVGLEHLTSLQHLFLVSCPKTTHLPEILLPSLLSLCITECPNLEGRCNRKGSYWSRISHIPCISINPKSRPFSY